MENWASVECRFKQRSIGGRVAGTLSPTKVWQAALGELEVALSKANFTTWFRNTRIIAINGDQAVIAVRNTFAQEWLQNKYHREILATLKRYYPEVARIEYRVTAAQSNPEDKVETNQNAELVPPSSTPRTTSTNSDSAIQGTSLNPDYTFETYVVGNANRLAHAAAKGVVENPGTQQYNPLFLYGGVGLGKTHLLQAIGNAVQQKNKKAVILYAPAEKFTTEFVQAMQRKTIDAFKRRYRNADVLLIDDIQFLSGKEGTQQEFFHTFNTLHQTNRQIVMTSDSRPQAIPQLEPRLSSRFGWGMVADIQTPDLETRQAILAKKCEEKSFLLADDVLDYMDRYIQSNDGEIEGALNGVMTHCELYGVQPSLKLIERILEQTGVDRRVTHVTTEAIFDTVADFYSLEVADLLGKRRNKELVRPRQIAMYLMRHELSYSYPKIGKALGGKDHTTVMHGVEKITRELTRTEALQRDISLIKERLYVSG